MREVRCCEVAHFHFLYPITYNTANATAVTVTAVAFAGLGVVAAVA